MRSLFVTLLLLNFLNFRVKAQKETISTENWESNPKIHSTETAFLKAPAWIVEDKRRIEFAGNSGLPTQEYYSQHKIIHVNEESGIDLFKKISLELGTNAQVKNFEARIILPNGKIIHFNQDKLISQNINGKDFKIINLDGLQKGCEIEYQFTFKKEANVFGREIIQSTLPEKVFSFEIISPSQWIFVQKPYNFQIIPVDTLLNNRRIVTTQLNDIPAFVQESFATNAINPYRIEYKLSSKINSAGQSERTFTYSDLAKKIYLHLSVPPQNEKVKTFIQANGWDKLLNDSIKILAVENFIKKNIKLDIDSKDSIFNTPANILERKMAGEDGLIRLFGCLFQELGIDFQFVTLGDRNGFPLDPDFSNWINAENYLIFFPATSKYLAPTQFNYRYPWFPSSWGLSSGLFCNNSRKGGIENLIAEIGTIDLEDAHKSFSNIDVKLEFNKGLDTLIIDNKFLFGGYPACKFRGILNQGSKESKQVLIKSLSRKVRNNENILFSEILNPELEKESPNIPFIVHTKSKDPLKKVDGRIVIKLSSILFPSQEINSESTRKIPIVQDYGNITGSKIQIRIPKGYSFKDLINLSKDQNFKENDENTLGISSGYELKGDLLFIHTQEYYTHTSYPADHLSIFTGIKKTASDIRKIVLVLVKN